ncbi:DUF4249 domain-containing protein [Shivajiella indica]|uniref:DUF4249 domain-containing protein n=1 Tax=Shivajiella indica TaxID=872115 RepID=A0ABW5B537_9BACT
MRNLIILLFSIGLFSCQEEVNLDLGTVEPMPVIEGVWTDAGALNFVRITKSKDFYDEEPNQVIDDALVVIRNLSTGFNIPFRYSNQANRYFPFFNVGGTIGDTYQLSVIWNGNEYVSEGILMEPPVLDSITYEFREERTFREEGYYITLYGKIPFTEDNNYRVRIIKNDTLMNNRNDYLLFDDTFGTSILDNGFELTGFPFKANDRVRLELFRLNRDAFDYLNQLVSLLFNDGGLFSPPPQNPQSNIRKIYGDQEALGYFMVSPVLSETLVIEPD